MIIKITLEELVEILDSIHCRACDEYMCDHDELVTEAIQELNKYIEEEE